MRFRQVLIVSQHDDVAEMIQQSICRSSGDKSRHPTIYVRARHLAKTFESDLLVVDAVECNDIVLEVLTTARTQIQNIPIVLMLENPSHALPMPVRHDQCFVIERFNVKALRVLVQELLRESS